ncbi:hypothetical protein [Streptacidiphilus fuscans]|uniref:Uncharacterized protein n=1 Tax=Streptacidiphilus fuscans TaxID=2789292 RepID=A0A931B7B6_9ACTN|nr:hypothetical protein [Streptacidiphilus fuscans]MBF9069173.1 hypothetical protein [Streptacidiphilus fuscans]
MTGSYPLGMYLFTGNGNTTPVRLAGNGGFSAVPAVIHTSVGDIMVGNGPLPPGYGNSFGNKYTGWYYWLGDSVDGHPLSLGMPEANLNNTSTVIENVDGDFLAAGNLWILPGGGYTTRCLSFLPNPTKSLQLQWLRLDSAADWVPASPGCTENSGTS